jgi:hypothetical protein
VAQWGNLDQANNSPKYGTELLSSGPVGSGPAAKAANNTALYQNVTPGAFVSGKAVGQFAVSADEMANTSGESQKVTHTGWQVRTQGTGDITGATVSDGGSSFANGETVTVSGGTTNATLGIVTDSGGNAVSASVESSGAGFINTSSLTYSFNRELHLLSVTVGGTPTGYSNTDVFTASNGIVNGSFSVSTNSTGGFVTANVTITDVGLWSNAAANTDVVFTVKKADGTATSGSGATFSANLTSSANGTLVATLGGRAGRITYETIVAGGIESDSAGDDTWFPQA